MPFGETWFQEGDSVNKPKYNSQELDAETGLYFYNARYYDGEIGRFVTADQVIDGEHDTQGWNRYSYVKNNPVMYKDPTGNLRSRESVVGVKENKDSVVFKYVDGGNWEEGDSLESVVRKQLEKDWREGARPMKSKALGRKEDFVTEERIADRKKNILRWNGYEEEKEIEVGDYIVTSKPKRKEMSKKMSDEVETKAVDLSKEIEFLKSRLEKDKQVVESMQIRRSTRPHLEREGEDKDDRSETKAKVSVPQIGGPRG